MLAYLIKITPDDNDTLLVTCPDLPEVTTFGKSKEDAERAALGAIEEAIAARISYGEPLPPPLPVAENRPPRNSMFVTLPAIISLKLQLYIMMRERGTTRAELSRLLGWHREQVDRLFRLDHASRLDQIEAAFKALNCEVDVNILERHPPARQSQVRKTAHST
jgi:antitoxin HicB